VDGECIVAVEDTGIGIPADKLERVFDEYYQVDTQGTKRAGVGLGLAIVREVARLLGFSIVITSAVGIGTQVRVRIPSRYIVDVPARLPPRTTVAAASVPRAGARLFLVEDNDAVRVAIETFLRLEGHEIQSAASMIEADAMLASLRQGDIVIADYHLDERSTGLEVVLKLRERVGYAVPAIILSGDLPSAMRSIKLPVPNCRFMSKPVDATELADTIAELQHPQSQGA
jgi:CheY-like chemotaxis protein